MAFDFSKLQETAAELAQKAVQGVNYVAQKGRETYDRLSLENELNKAQRRLGAYYYNQVRMGADHEVVMAECVSRSDDLLEQLNALDGEPVEPVGEEQTGEKGPYCAECGAVHDSDAVFCAQCGAKL